MDWVTRDTTKFDHGDAPAPVFSYSARIRLKAETTGYSFADPIKFDDVAVMLAKPPEWTLDSWGVYEPKDWSDLTYLALRRVKALLDFDAGLSDGSGDELRSAVYRRFPQVEAASRTPSDYAVFVVDATIFPDGRSEWGIASPSDGALPPGVKPDDDFASGSDIKVFLQNLFRASVADDLSR